LREKWLWFWVKAGQARSGIRISPAVEALGMWESRRDFQEEWKGWKTGFMVFHAFHSSSFPTLFEGGSRTIRGVISVPDQNARLVESEVADQHP
jgi:hypothetical protein